MAKAQVVGPMVVLAMVVVASCGAQDEAESTNAVFDDSRQVDASVGFDSGEDESASGPAQYSGSIRLDGDLPAVVEWNLNATAPTSDVTRAPAGEAALRMRVSGSISFSSGLEGRSLVLRPGGMVKLGIGPNVPGLDPAGMNVIVSPDDPFGGLGTVIEVQPGDTFQLDYDSSWTSASHPGSVIADAIDEVNSQQVEFNVWLEAAWINGLQFSNFVAR